MIVYHEEIQPAAKVAEHTPILVSENFFRSGDQFRKENGEQVDKFVTEEFLVDTVYGCHIVVTNPTSSKKKVEVLLQIPAGALPVADGQYTHSIHLDLDPYHTQTLEYRFYFPLPGKFAHYPVQVAGEWRGARLSRPRSCSTSSSELTKIDKQSWDYISQYGSEDDVLTFLKTENILRVNLDRIAWRMQDKAFFEKVIRSSRPRHVYNNTLWSYGVKHDDVPAIRQFLQFADDFVNQCGEWLDSPLLTIDPVARHAYEQMDYRPLVNARVGQLGRKREILNDRVFCPIPAAADDPQLPPAFGRRRAHDGDLLSAVARSGGRIAGVLRPRRCRPSGDAAAIRLFRRLFGFLQVGAAIWPGRSPRNMPTIRSIAGARRLPTSSTRPTRSASRTCKIADKRRPHAGANRRRPPPRRRSISPSKARHVKINYQNLKSVQVNYYQMDIELLFSRNPFVQGEVEAILQHPAEPDRNGQVARRSHEFRFPIAGQAAE